MPKRVEIDGTLTTQSGDVYQVRLAGTVKELAGAAGVEAGDINDLELLTDVPGGDYVLDYFYLRPHHDRVRVRFGRLIGPW